MAAPINLEVGFSASSSSGASAGAGDFIIKGGGGSSATGARAKATGAEQIPLGLIIAAAVVAIFLFTLFFGRKKRR